MLNICLAINPMDKLNQNQHAAELVEELWKPILLGHCVLFKFLDVSKNFFQVLQPCNSDTESSNSDQSQEYSDETAIKDTSSLLFLSQAWLENN